MFEAMHTGHSVYATVHADSIGETIKRLMYPPIEVPANLLSAVNLNVVMFRDRRKGLRRVLQVGEYIEAGESGGVTVNPNILYRWKADRDQIIKHADSLKLKEDLTRLTGMTQKEINTDLKEKEKILLWMVKHKMRSIKSVGQVMDDYYLDPETILKKVTAGKKI